MPSINDRGGLRVWRARDGEGYWNPERGNLVLPQGWVFVPPGDAFVTREVKKGPHWVLCRRRKGYTATLGVFCPDAAVTSAEERAQTTAATRERRRTAARAARERAENRHRAAFEQAVLRFLSFAPEHEPLAREIARESAAQATAVRRGHVGRTRRLSLADRAELAARAWIRHKHTDYEALLWDMSGENPTIDVEDHKDPAYRAIRSEAQRETDDFLREHRGREELLPKLAPSRRPANGPATSAER
ncbi:MAG: DUF2293 domain-containing protein [Thermoplasmata archaeon]